MYDSGKIMRNNGSGGRSGRRYGCGEGVAHYQCATGIILNWRRMRSVSLVIVLVFKYYICSNNYRWIMFNNLMADSKLGDIVEIDKLGYL